MTYRLAGTKQDRINDRVYEILNEEDATPAEILTALRTMWTVVSEERESRGHLEIRQMLAG